MRFTFGRAISNGSNSFSNSSRAGSGNINLKNAINMKNMKNMKNMNNYNNLNNNPMYENLLETNPKPNPNPNPNNS